MTKVKIKAQLKKLEKQFNALDKVCERLAKQFNATLPEAKEEILSRKLDRYAEKLDDLDSKIGRLYFKLDHMRETTAAKKDSGNCGRCKGKGETASGSCMFCNGTGRKRWNKEGLKKEFWQS